VLQYGRREEQFYESCDNMGCFALKSTINFDTNQLMKYKINFPVDEFKYNNQFTKQCGNMCGKTTDSLRSFY
jgi:hypothetical protein